MQDYSKFFEAISPYYKICTDCGSLELNISKYCWKCHSQNFSENVQKTAATVKDHEILKRWMDQLSYQEK